MQAERRCSGRCSRPRPDRDDPDRGGSEELPAVAQVAAAQGPRPRDRVKEHEATENGADEHVPAEQRHPAEAGVEPRSTTRRR